MTTLSVLCLVRVCEQTRRYWGLLAARGELRNTQWLPLRLSSYYRAGAVPEKTKLLSPREEKELFREVRKHVPGAFDRAVKQYLRWALKLATAAQGRTSLKGARLDIDEAISAANAGLVEAIRTFRSSKRARFTTHGFTVVRRYLINALLATYPVHVTYYFRRKIADADPAATQTVFEQLFSDESAELQLASMHERPEDSPFLPVEGEDPAEACGHTRLTADVRAFLDTLEPVERAAILGRYYADPTQSFETMGRRLKISKNTVREAHDVALAKLKRRFGNLK